jgi:hypothetical protein
MKTIRTVLVGFAALMMIGAMANASPMVATQLTRPASIKPWVAGYWAGGYWGGGYYHRHWVPGYYVGTGYYGRPGYYHHPWYHHRHWYNHVGVVVHL